MACESANMSNNMTKKILLIEDDEFLRKMYATKLENSGFDVIIASNGEEAIGILPKDKPDIILTDILMPKKDGFEFLREMRSLPEYKSIPVIVLTNLSEDQDLKRAKELGASEYIVKAHFLPSEVVEVIKKYICQK